MNTDLWPHQAAAADLLAPTVEFGPARLSLADFPREVIADIAKAFSWPVPGAHFAQKAHRKKHPMIRPGCSFCLWDGTRSLLERDNTLPIGFAFRLNELLRARPGFEFAVLDNSGPVPDRQYDWHLSADLRDYQREALAAAQYHRHGIFQAATGAGKSIMAAALICDLGLPAVVVVPTKLLAGQFLETFRAHTDCPVGLIGSGKWEPAPVQIAIAQSLVSGTGAAHTDRLDRRVLVIDEMHLSATATWEAICNACPAYYRYGFSATPYRKTELEDNLLMGLCGPVIAQVGVVELQNSGHLAQTDIRVIHMPVGYRRMIHDDSDDGRGGVIGWRETSYVEKYKEAVVENGWRNQQIADLVNRHAADGLKVLVSVAHMDHAARLMALLDCEPIFLSGRDSNEATEAKRRQFRDQPGGVCIGTSVVDTGFDVPALGVLVLAAGGEFDGRSVQRLGRGLRPSPGKDRVIVYDLRDEDKPLFRYHARSRMRTYENLGQKVTEYENAAAALASEAAPGEQERLAL
ncbi:MAG: DEAD/DEAH box helicase [Opitutaceae bacterium]